MLKKHNKYHVEKAIWVLSFLICMAAIISIISVKKARAADVKYVTPQKYGAVADGVADDTAALQAAIDSGFSVFIPDGEYFITGQIKVYNKKNLWVQGSSKAVIHREYSASKRAYLFNLQNCESCVFKDLNITSDINGTGTIPNGHTRPNNVSSNILAFGGKANKKIYFYNNSFTNMESDYWFNDADTGWKTIAISGWNSRNSATALYGQKVTGLTITDADIVLNSDVAGDGDHCIYIADGSSNIRIKNSTFDAGKGEYADGSPNSVLTFHRTSNANANEYVSDVILENCKIKGARFLYGNGGAQETITVKSCSFEETFSRGSDYTGAFGGDSNYRVMNSDIVVKTYTVTGQQDPDTGFLFYRCNINAGNLNTACFANATNMWVYNCNINLGKMLIYTNESNSSVNVTFNGCNVYASGDSYLLSKRYATGTVVVSNCTIENSETADVLVYNGKKIDMSGFVINDSTINGYNKIASDATIKNATINNTWLNGELIN